MVFCLFSTILQSDFGQQLLKWHPNGWDSLLLATKEHLRHICVLLLSVDSKPIYRFVMHHNSTSLKELCHAGDQFREQSLDKGKELEPRLFELIA